MAEVPRVGDARGMRNSLSAVLNVIWLVFGGIWLAAGYALAGVICCLLIVTIPFGIASFRIALYALWPFGRTVVDRGQVGAMSTIGNVIWILVAGIWIAIGHVADGHPHVCQHHRHPAGHSKPQDDPDFPDAAGQGNRSLQPLHARGPLSRGATDGPTPHPEIPLPAAMARGGIFAWCHALRCAALVRGLLCVPPLKVVHAVHSLWMCRTPNQSPKGDHP